MSVIWMDDPSFYTQSQMTQRYDVVNGMTLSAGTGRFGTTSWHMAGGAACQLVKNIPGGALATVTIGFSFKLSTAVSGTQLLCAFLDTGSNQCELRMNAANQFLFTRNGTPIGSVSASALTVGVWYRIEVKVTIDPSAGSIELRVQGTSTGWIGPTGSLNTRSTANSSTNQIQLGGTPSVVAQPAGDISDFVITNTSSPNANFLGDKRCFLRVPSSDSSVAWTPTFASFLNGHAYVVGEQFKDSNNNVQRTTIAGTSAGAGTPTWATAGGSTTTSGGATFVVVGTGANPGAHNWMAASENPTDDDSSYNVDSTPGDIDAFGFPTLPAGTQNISAVDNILRCRKDDAGVRSIATYINSGGTVGIGATIPLSTSYIYVDTVNETDPNTSAAWTVSNLNAATLGYKEIA